MTGFVSVSSGVAALTGATLPTMVVMPGLVPGIHALLIEMQNWRGWPGQARP